ncbi:hypothetical protein BJY22_006155 [Kribbella shirazensis]|uniref:Uncharacterized protein n=1 Tax=Kribbella shirazensis TaxID=1105143 RepID=A0A7X6A3Z8_9ACTN|nr:hypothetical protein [Kribbella shirazensis]
MFVHALIGMLADNVVPLPVAEVEPMSETSCLPIQDGARDVARDLRAR